MSDFDRIMMHQNFQKIVFKKNLRVLELLQFQFTNKTDMLLTKAVDITDLCHLSNSLSKFQTRIDQVKQ
jgi:hypothetical protein